MPLLLDIAITHLAGRKRQSMVAVVGVAVGVGFFLAVSALMVGSQNDFITRLIDAAPHIVVTDEIRSPRSQPGMVAFDQGAVALRHFKIRTEARGIKDWPAIIASADTLPGSLSSASLSGGVTLKLGGHEEALGIIGIDPEKEARVGALETNLRTGRLRDLKTTQGGLIVGEELATRLGVGMGDVVAATSASGVTRSLRIVGLLKRGQTAIADTSGYVLLREAQSLLARPFIINRIGIKLRDPNDADGVAKRLEARFGYRAQSWQERSSDILSVLVTRNVIMYTVVSAILLVASFGIYTAVSTSVSDKRRDIAILRSIGFSQGDLQLVFVIEGLIVAVIGIVLGWALGYGLMAALGSLRFPVAGEDQYLPLDHGVRQYLIAATASLFAGIIAAWLPARKAARVDPVDILRGAA